MVDAVLVVLAISGIVSLQSDSLVVFQSLLVVCGLYLLLDAISDARSSSISSPAAEMFGPKTILGTTETICCMHKFFCIFIGAQNKLGHFLEPPPATADLTHEI